MKCLLIEACHAIGNVMVIDRHAGGQNALGLMESCLLTWLPLPWRKDACHVFTLPLYGHFLPMGLNSVSYLPLVFH